MGVMKMANKSNNSNRKKSNFIPTMGKNKGFNQQIGRQVFDKRRKDNAKVKY